MISYCYDDSKGSKASVEIDYLNALQNSNNIVHFARNIAGEIKNMVLVTVYMSVRHIRDAFPDGLSPEDISFLTKMLLANIVVDEEMMEFFAANVKVTSVQKNSSN